MLQWHRDNPHDGEIRHLSHPNNNINIYLHMHIVNSFFFKSGEIETLL